ncbi:hypothetical protein K443DRAFT_100040 [Laccaria amethystina LaAM-08-1]|uniref:Gpi1-domain-containing protein n=1 Tax=Laccaria amethystina LaAM-08-1 TaxID=1095629 RepID=A0A0C9XXN2_9AGAR|nr:hypothetical protein K443DRAFT_100040 [Laccaria amethystina LaAM-08-1]
MSTTTRTIFWPVDLPRDVSDGFCYGWSAATKVCVAGVLDVDTEDDARDVMSSLDGVLVESCGSQVVVLGKSAELQGNTIFYHRHRSHSLRFYYLHPDDHDEHNPSPYFALSQHDFTHRPLRRHDGLDDTSVNQFNSAMLIESLVSPRPSRKLVPRTASILFAVASILARPMLLLMRCIAPIRAVYLPSFLRASAVVQQLDVRAEQAQFFVSQIGSLQRRDTVDIPSYASRYTNFFNTVWLVLNDVTIGIALGTFLSENHHALAHIINTYAERFLVEEIKWALIWLDSWPAGLKLNTELSSFYSHTFIGLVDIFAHLLTNHIQPHTPALITILGYASIFGGITLAVSLLMDVLAVLLTPHIFICYILARAVYARVGGTLGSLWALFRGKRYNVLRNRMDSWEYDLDQLLFGTVLFTLLAFLFPTVFVYYALFAVLRLITLLIQASMETLLAFMNHFPLFALMLRIKDPWRLPGGVYFLFVPSTRRGSQSRLILENQPARLSSIFFQYINLWARLARHYNPLRLLYCVLSGRYLAAIPRYEIRYGYGGRGRVFVKTANFG